MSNRDEIVATLKKLNLIHREQVPARFVERFDECKRELQAAVGDGAEVDHARAKEICERAQRVIEETVLAFRLGG